MIYYVYFGLIALITILLVLVISLFFNFIIKKKLKVKGYIISILLSLILSLFIVVVIYLCDYNHANAESFTYLESKDSVTVKKEDEGYFFDGEGEADFIVFYPGAKVEAEAYAELLFNLAKEGIDCYLVKMPFNIAIMGATKASIIFDRYKYENNYMMGHSLGGAIAANYVAENYSTYSIKGLVLLASYSTSKIDDTLSVLSIYGTNDGILNLSNYNKNKGNLPQSALEYVIDGANHSYFGDYGIQRGDEEASITYLEQQTLVKNKIFEFI